MFWQDAHSAFALHALFWPAVQLRRHLLCSGSDARSRPTGGVIDKLSQQQQVMPVACKRVSFDVMSNCSSHSRQALLEYTGRHRYPRREESDCERAAYQSISSTCFDTST